MANDREIKEIVARVTADVINETRGKEAAFTVSDLSTHLRNIAKGDEVAWTISYSTAAASLSEAGIRTNPLNEVAWSITYSTSAAVLQQELGTVAKK
jgi:hypothetical protein